jgi:hypothetical protein
LNRPEIRSITLSKEQRLGVNRKVTGTKEAEVIGGRKVLQIGGVLGKKFFPNIT